MPAVCLEAGVRYEIRLHFGEKRSGYPDRQAQVINYFYKYQNFLPKTEFSIRQNSCTKFRNSGCILKLEFLLFYNTKFYIVQ